MKTSALFDHFHYIADKPRNEQYLDALKRQARDKVVLDLGCGTGILGILALKAGARRVIAVDHDPVMLEEAKDIAARFGLRDKITHVNAMVDRPDHPVWNGVELCVHEMLGNAVIEEDCAVALRGVTVPLIPSAFSFRISFIELSVDGFYHRVLRDSDPVLAQWFLDKLKTPKIVQLHNMEDVGHEAQIGTGQWFKFNEMLDAYEFAVATNGHYDWLGVKIEGLLQFSGDAPYRMSHAHPCAWGPTMFVGSMLRNVADKTPIKIRILPSTIVVEVSN